MTSRNVIGWSAVTSHDFPTSVELQHAEQEAGLVFAYCLSSAVCFQSVYVRVIPAHRDLKRSVYLLCFGYLHSAILEKSGEWFNTSAILLDHNK